MVLALRSRGETQRSDQRILGDGDFVQDILPGLEGMVKKNLRLSGRRMDIKALAQPVCGRYAISPAKLRAGSRRRVVVETREAVSRIAVREPGNCGAHVARYLGVNNSCVTRFVAAGNNPEVDDLIGKL